MSKRLLATFLALFPFSLPMISHAEFLDFYEESEQALFNNTVIGGEEVTPDSRVYKMSVRLRMDMGSAIGVCSGTLIAKDLVLTAAHCADASVSSISISTLGGRESIPATQWLVHPGYAKIPESGLVRPINDIALVKLGRNAGPGTLIAELPSSQMSVGSTIEMVLAGFGRTTPEEGSNPINLLHFAWTNGTMIAVGSGDPLDYQIEMSGVQPCSGDSGGPIFKADPKHLVVMGVTSHGQGECSQGGRAISIRHHLPWLRSAAKRLRSSFDI